MPKMKVIVFLLMLGYVNNGTYDFMYKRIDDVDSSRYEFRSWTERDFNPLYKRAAWDHNWKIVMLCKNSEKSIITQFHKQLVFKFYSQDMFRNAYVTGPFRCIGYFD